MSGTWLEYGVYGFFHVQESWKHSPLMPGHESYTSSWYLWDALSM